MPKIVPKRIIDNCGQCPFQYGGTMLDSTCGHLNAPSWRTHNTETPLVGFPSWCPLKDAKNKKEKKC
jgi:hypothetical protein